MKFALFALIASAAAIRITASEGPCVSMGESNNIFGEVDTNHNGEVSKAELTVAVKHYLQKHNIHPTPAQVA